MRWVGLENPAQVRVPETLGHRYRGGAKQPRRMRVTVCVGEGVVASVVSDPVDHRTLKREAARHSQGDAHAGLANDRYRETV